MIINLESCNPRKFDLLFTLIVVPWAKSDQCFIVLTRDILESFKYNFNVQFTLALNGPEATSFILIFFRNIMTVVDDISSCGPGFLI